MVRDITITDDHVKVKIALTVVQSLPLDGVIVVSSPQDLASLIVTKAVNMAKKMNTEIFGLIENMSFLECPGCGEKVHVFGPSQGEKLAEQLGILFLGSIPIDPMIARKSDEGRIEDYSSSAFNAPNQRPIIPSVPASTYRAQTAVLPHDHPVFSIKIGSINGESTIGDLIVAFSRARDVLMKHGLRFDVEDAGYLYMTLNIFSAIHGLAAGSLVQELHNVSLEPPVQPPSQQLRTVTAVPSV